MSSWTENTAGKIGFECVVLNAAIPLEWVSLFMGYDTFTGWCDG